MTQSPKKTDAAPAPEPAAAPPAKVALTISTKQPAVTKQATVDGVVLKRGYATVVDADVAAAILKRRDESRRPFAQVADANLTGA